MFAILWEYQVRADRQAEFERMYAPDGDWAKLFKQAAGYLGTELLRDTQNPDRYLTVDRWEMSRTFRVFLETGRQDYDALDARCAGLTEWKNPLGELLISP